jgi:hypothetical protein
VKRGFDWDDRRAPIEEFETEVRCKRRCQRKAEQETRLRIFPASVGSYLPQASWADKFRAAGFRVTEG